MLLTPRACGATPPVLHDQLQGEGKSTLAALRSPAHSSDAAAAALAGLVQRFQAEQQQFCSELAAGTPQPGGTPPNDTYFVHTVAMEHGGVQSSVAMYALSGEDIVSHDIQTKGSWELAETREVLDRLQEWRDMHVMDSSDVVFVDVGANIGWHSIYAAAVGYTVLAFEPMLKNIGAVRRTLCENSELQQRLTLVSKGLSHKPASCKFLVRTNNRGNGVAVCGAAEVSKWLAPGSAYEEAGEFELTTLDEVLEGSMGALEGRVAAMKVDVEVRPPLVPANSGTDGSPRCLCLCLLQRHLACMGGRGAARSYRMHSAPEQFPTCRVLCRDLSRM
jgi:FkbM family methyltransferase